LFPGQRQPGSATGFDHIWSCDRLPSVSASSHSSRALAATPGRFGSTAPVPFENLLRMRRNARRAPPFGRAPPSFPPIVVPSSRLYAVELAPPQTLDPGFTPGDSRFLWQAPATNEAHWWPNGSFQRGRTATCRPNRKAVTLRLPGGECADLRADYLAGDHQFHTPILLPAVRGVVGSNRLSFAKTPRRD